MSSGNQNRIDYLLLYAGTIAIEVLEGVTYVLVLMWQAQEGGWIKVLLYFLLCVGDVYVCLHPYVFLLLLLLSFPVPLHAFI